MNHALFFLICHCDAEMPISCPTMILSSLMKLIPLNRSLRSSGISVTEGQIDYLLNKLYNGLTQRGLLVALENKGGQQLVESVRIRSREFFMSVMDWSETHCRANGRLEGPVRVSQDLPDGLRELAILLGRSAEAAKNDGDKRRAERFGNEMSAAGRNAPHMARPESPDSVYWIERTSGRTDRLSLMSSPVDVGGILKQELFNKVPSVIMTSATLATGAKGLSFLSVSSRVSGRERDSSWESL